MLAKFDKKDMRYFTDIKMRITKSNKSPEDYHIGQIDKRKKL